MNTERKALLATAVVFALTIGAGRPAAAADGAPGGLRAAWANLVSKGRILLDKGRVLVFGYRVASEPAPTTRRAPVLRQKKRALRNAERRLPRAQAGLLKAEREMARIAPRLRIQPGESPIRLEAVYQRQTGIRGIPAGTSLDEVVSSMLRFANQSGLPFAAKFNDLELVARPGMTPRQVKAPYVLSAAQARVSAAEDDIVTRRQSLGRLKAFAGPLLDGPPAGMKLHRSGIRKPESKYNDNAFKLQLVTPEQIDALPKGTVLYSILGKKKVVGVDRFDRDTRGGFSAYGFRAN